MAVSGTTNHHPFARRTVHESFLRLDLFLRNQANFLSIDDRPIWTNYPRLLLKNLV